MLQIHRVIVPFRNRSRGNFLRPINRIKHVFDLQGAVVAGVVQSINFIRSNDDPVLATPEEVLTGSTVNGAFFIVEVNATTSAALANVYMAIFKNPGGDLVFPAPNVVGASDLKRYSVHQEMVMMQQVTNSNPRTLFKGVVKFPRGYKRNAPNDIWTMRILAPGVNIQFCVQIHFKEFR